MNNQQIATGLCNKSAVKTIAKNHEIRVSEELYSAIDEKIRELIENAVLRAKANHRTTLLKQDI